MTKQHLPWLMLLLAPAMHCNSAITMAKVSNISLGKNLAGAAGRQWILSTTGAITGSAQVDYISGASAAEIIMTDTSAPALVQIQAINITAFNGLSVNQIFCSFDNATQARCDLTGYVVTTGVVAGSLKLGIDLESTQYHYGNDSASVDFDVSITYQ